VTYVNVTKKILRHLTVRQLTHKNELLIRLSNKPVEWRPIRFGTFHLQILSLFLSIFLSWFAMQNTIKIH